MDTKTLKETVEWKCVNCGKLLGMVDQRRSIVRMKLKDYIVEIEGGRISTPCRGCLWPNEIADQNWNNFQIWLKEKRKEV